MLKFIIIESNLDYNDYNFHIRDEKNDMLLYNISPFERFSGILFKIFRGHLSIKLNNIIQLPFKQIWNPYILDKKLKTIADNSNELCFLFEGSSYRFVECGFVQYLRKKYKNCYLVFFFDGRVDVFKREYKHFSIEQMKKIFDIVISYNKSDTEKYGLLLKRPKLIDYKVYQYSGRYKNSDAFFVGAAKDRLKDIFDVYKKLSNAGLKCDFHITDVDTKDQLYAESISYNKRMEYSEVLSRVAATKCVVNILEGGNSGITLRDYEAIAFEKLLITNNYGFSKTDLFIRENTIFVDEISNSIDKIKNKVMPIHWPVKEEFNSKNYYKWLGEKLKATRIKHEK